METTKDTFQAEAWVVALQDLLGSTDSRLCGKFDNYAVIITQLFKKVTNPPISVRNGVKVEVPANYTIKIGGSRRLYSILGDPDLFESLPLNLRKGILDLMSLLLSRGTTYVVRFQCHNTETAYSRADTGGGAEGGSSESLTKIFLALLDRSRRDNSSIDVSKRIVHLLGLTAAAGLSISDNRDVLALLQAPSELTVSLLQALKNMTRMDNSIVKANPGSFFNLGGQEAGITSGRMNFPFNNKEYQFITWFRVEEFENTKLNWAAMHGGDSHRRGSGVTYGQTQQDTGASHAFRTTQHHVVSMLNASGKGFDLFIQDKVLHYYVSFSNEESLVIKLDGLPLRRGVWYHVAVTHQRASRLSMFAKDELTIHIDHKLAYQANIRYPTDPNSPYLEGMKFEVGANFDGQISPVYFFKDALEPSEVEMVARADAGKPIDSRAFQTQGDEKREGSTSDSITSSKPSVDLGAATPQGEGWDHSVKYMDLMDTLSVSGRTVAIYGKVATAYHPARCMYNHALDVQGGRHAMLGRRTQAWNIFNVCDMLGSLGGISCVLPMFPRLLIDKSASNGASESSRPSSPRVSAGESQSQAQTRDSVTSLPSPMSDVGFGTSWGDVYSGDSESGYDLLDASAKEELRAEMVEVEEDTCIALILEILSNLLQHHRIYQREMLAISGPDMIEYALTCVSNEVLCGEGERCVLALHGLCTSVQELPALHTKFIRCLFLNLHIWWRSSFHMQSSLMHLVMASLKKDPAKFGALIDVHDLLTAMYAYYRDVDEEVPLPTRRGDTSAGSGSFNARLSVVRSNSIYRDIAVAGGANGTEANRARSGTEESFAESVSTDGGDGDEVFRREMTEDSARSRLLSDESMDALSGHINYSLDNQQRKSLRWCIQSIIMAVVESSQDPLRYYKCLLDFIATCKDLIVLDEVAQMLLIFIVEDGGERASKVIGSIIEACHGPEEFSSFILRYVVHRPSEDLRCTGIRIITHFYLRLGKVSPTLSKLSLKNSRHGSNLVAMAVERLQDLGRGAEDPGLRRLQVCGGMALLTEVVTSHADSSTISTYAALLEMLLTKPGDVSDVTIMHKNVFDNKLTPHLGGNGSGVSNDLTMTMKVSQFTARYMQPDHFDESEESALNTAVLPVFLDLLPKLTLGSAQQQILSDLLSLLKHSESNRDVFCGSEAWHLSMFDIVSRYVIIRPGYGDEGSLLRFDKMGQTLEKWAQHAAWLMARAKNQPVQEAKSALLHRMEQQRKYAGALSQSSLLEAEAMKLREEKKSAKEEEQDEEDTWFAIGMKVYATLLLHALQAKEGWHEVGRTLSLSLTNPSARIVHFAVLSHLVNELTFIMQWRYRELQRLASSSSSDETNEALNYLDNIFSVFITTGQHVIFNKPSVTTGIRGWGLAKLRIMYLKEVIEGRRRRNVEGGAYSDDSDNSDEKDDDAHRDDEYLYELAEAMLVERATIRKRRDSLNKQSGEDDIPHPEYSGEDIGLGSTVISLDRNEKASMHPYLKNAENYLDFSGHVWIDLGNDKNVSVPAGRGASAALEAGRKRFTVSEFLHPLGRTQNIPTAQLVLLLQNLRFFDVFFWPSDELPLRNSPMLRFHKEKPASEDEEEQAVEPPLTICMSVMCQAFYVLQTLSPTNDLAELNVNRIHAIIESIDNVSRYATPVDDLLLAALVHLTTALQTVAQSLQSLFEMIGITEEVKIINIGLSSVEDDDREDKRVEEEERRFDTIYEDSGTCRLVEEYFDTAPGTNVLHFVKAVALALVSLMDMRRELLSEAMDEFAFNCLESLVDRINFDLDFHLKAEQAKAQEAEARRRSSVGTAQVKFKPAGVAVSASSSSGSLQSQAEGNPGTQPQRGAHSKPQRAPTQPGATGLPEDYSYSIGSVHGRGGDGGAYSPEEDHVDEIDGGDEGRASSRRGSFDPRDSVTEYGDIFEMGSSKKEKGANNTDRNSSDSSSPSRHYSRMKPNERSRGHSLQQKLRDGGDGGQRRRASTTPASGSSRVEDGARTSSVDLGDMARAFDQSSGYHGVDHAAHFSGQLIIKMMQWLRDLYLSCNLNRSVGVVKSLMQLEYHEIGSQRGYQSELRVLGKTVLEASSYVSEKNVAEMSDLSNLSAFVAKRMASRHAARNRTKAATDNLKLKGVAKRWNDNMRIFGAEWSPWRGESSEETEQADGVAMYELSRHKDSMMRRMVMVPSEYGADHRTEAYSEGKERDQIMFEMGLDPRTDEVPADMGERLRLGGTLDGAGGAKEGDGKTAAPFTDILKNVQIKTAAAENDKEWGDSDDDDDDPDFAEESTMMAALNPSSVAGVLFADDIERERADDSDEAGMAQGHHPLQARGMNPLNMLGGMTNKDIRPEWTIAYQWGANERCISVVEASRITLDKVMSGQLLLTNKHLYFHPRKVVGGLAMAGKAKNSSLISFHDRRWNIEGLYEVYGRRYLLQNCAIECFFTDGAEAFFAFENPGVLQKFFRAIRRLYTPRLRTPRTLNPRSLIRHSQYTDMWRRRQISNFEYLMVLNVMAGRSYNDITQYPVFPWVVSDYTSQTLDLSGKTPGVFRDLSKPIGAINPERLQEILDRYRSFDEDTPEQLKFMYGSHYSSAGVVVHYLLRQEPFTSLAINLQGGRFDCPDRLFFSMKNCWQGVNTSVSDVKELIPELYSCPEVFMNSNRLPLGELQEGGKVDDVVLPPWAHGSPFEFVRRLREALESDYVSENLHHWIDLIFGYKQQGAEAIKAHNLFYYLTYENSVDIDAIDDPLKREAAKTQVIHFGQTPSQLFKSPHEARLPRQDCLTPVCSDRDVLHRLTVYTPNQQLGKEGLHGAVIDVRCNGDKLVTLHADLTVCSYQWSAFPDGNGSPFDIRPLKSRTLPCASQSRSKDILERRSYVPLVDGSNDDTTSSIGSAGAGAGGFAQGGNTQPQSTSSNDMLKKFSRGISRGFSLFKEAAGAGTPGAAPGLSSMGLAEAEEPPLPPGSRALGGSPAGPRLDSPSIAVDGHSLPPPPSAFDDSGNPMSPPTYSVTSPRRLSTGSLGHRGSPSSSASSVYNEGNFANETSSSSLADRLTSETSASADSQGSNDRDSESTFSPRSITSNTASGVRLALPQTNHHHVALDMAGGKVISCGYWDHTLKVHALDSFKTLTSSKGGHVGAITCLNHGTDHSNGTIIATGGEDGTVRIWADRDREEGLAQLSDAVDSGNRFRQNEMRRVCTLWGHTSAVTCLSYSPDLDLALSASATGLLCVHSVRKGQYLRGLRYLEGRNVVSVLAAGAGYLLASTSDKSPSKKNDTANGNAGAVNTDEDDDDEVSVAHELHLFWINGQHLRSMPTSSKVSATALNRSRDMLAVGGEDGSLQIVILNSLEFMCEFGLTQHGAVSSLWFSDDKQFLMIGSQDGTFHVMVDPQTAFAKAQGQLQKTAILGAL